MNLNDVIAFRQKIHWNTINSLLGVNDELHNLAKSKNKTVRVAEDFKETKGNCNIKIPHIALKKFNGHVPNFQEFWVQFIAAIHKNDSLMDVETVNYFKSLLTDLAAKVISRLLLTSNKYKKAIEIK